MANQVKQNPANTKRAGTAREATKLSAPATQERNTQRRDEARKRLSGAEQPPFAPNCVTIFGGGITGLTAAHELIERGFRVQVWERVHDEREPSRGCDVGGMARTQWSRAHWEEQDDAGSSRLADAADWKSRRTEEIQALPWVLYLSNQGYDFNGAIGKTEAYLPGEPGTGPGIKKILEELSNAFKPYATDPRKPLVYCESQRREPARDASGPEEGRVRARKIVNAMKAKGLPPDVADLIVLDAGQDGDPGLYAEHLTARLTWKTGQKLEFRLTLLDGFPEGLPESVGERISFRVRERWIPGEHGFRFFPAFYHHLFDTMKRTPILEPAPKSEIAAAQERTVTVNPNPDKYVETSRSVYDNLHPTTKQAIAIHGGRRPSVMARTLPTSFEEIREWLRLVLQREPKDPPEALLGKTQGSGLSPRAPTSKGASDPSRREPSDEKGGFELSARDIAQFHLKVLQYLTSCDARKVEYENMSWLEFLGGTKAYTAQFTKVINKWPEALVAMDARTCDARTQGAVLAQLMLDNLRLSGYRDGTLEGPTTVAWLTPWRRYLEAQGVEFIHGELEGFQTATDPNGAKIVWPKVRCYEPRYPGALERQPSLMPGYFLLALPALESKRVALEFKTALDRISAKPLEGSDLLRTIAFFEDDDERAQRDPTPSGNLRHMIGIQYYFDEDVYWMDGHFYLPLSLWGLTAISQVRFWEDKHDWEHGYRGILSVVFTVMKPAEDPPDPEEAKETKTKKGVKAKKETKKTVAKRGAWESEPDEIAEEIWRQIKEALRNQDLPEPCYWHIDSGFKRLERENKYDNQTPLLVNLPGRWEDRPGDLIPIEEDQDKFGGQLSLYKVERGVVMAGTHMKTYTRLTTMEAANESARHAVNAILQDARDLALKAKPASGASKKGGKEPDPVPTRLTPCDIWPIERREVKDFKFLREIDEELYARNLDHFIDILDLAEAVRTSLRGARNRIRDPFDTFSVLTHLDRMVRSYGGKVTDLVSKEEAVE